MEVRSSSKMLVITYKTACRHNPEDKQRKAILCFHWRWIKIGENKSEEKQNGGKESE